MSAPTQNKREGSLEAPTRHPLDWRNPDFYDEGSLFAEMERVFDICHGCRRCVSLCNSFPTLFDLVDESETMEVDGVKKDDYWKVVDHCYLCDLCYLTKCPYVPPHEWNVDFPHLMLRGKAVRFKKEGAKTAHKLMSSTDLIGTLAGIPVVAQTVNAVNRNGAARKLLDKTLGVHPEASLPKYHSRKGRKRAAQVAAAVSAPEAVNGTTGRVALFATCYGNYNEPHIVEDLVQVFNHNGIEVTLLDKEQCCGMPKLELGDLEAVAAAKDVNVPAMKRVIDQGYDIVGPVPSCVLMFKQELPLMFPDNADVQAVKKRIFDPFEYLMARHAGGRLKTDFPQRLGKVAYHAACHLRVQNMGLKTRDLLKLVPGTEIDVIERCSGHDGTYGVKTEFFETATKICRPVVSRVQKAEADHFSSDCPMAGHMIENGLKDGREPEHPLTLLRKAYGL
ncbi:Fe-S oxidoreductase-like protein in Rubrerythrin cluster [Thioalkalivibrio nitratireducens DSM 14787]|uniref:Fe-S oxidoreductase-like protein in Rubrerythrin cluster n=1 Tax=Thioalkalivibrio nitratireducens (strain DSM 14787 / UNIQEM 213 / ALEN2) TaxID=1255043 RepID=L0E1E2_THIND|nr:heterodisulfide reductase-related iron-sulfur binding cluster [Thioalkalivibrio nitratireducens]AGA35067.1 Fe-S oxidoreductase-like protein in Rubrerythrin cluster [Thioalkalivibrio nitratireducens DSM 14787]